MSPVPIPRYAFARKRSSTRMNGIQEAPLPKRQQVNHINADKAQDETPKAAALAQAQRFTEAAASQHLNQSMKLTSQSNSPGVATGIPGRSTPIPAPSVPGRSPSAQNSPSQTPTDQRGPKTVEIGGVAFPIIEMAGKRRYREYEGSYP